MAKSEMLELKELHFNGAMINKPLVRKFIIKNNSGITTGFKIYSEHYEPAQYMDDQSPINVIQTNPIMATPTVTSKFSESKKSIL